MIRDNYRLLVPILFVLGCASGGTAAQKQPSLPPARLVRVATMQLDRQAGKGPWEVDITYEVVIRPNGSPDFNTLKVIGKGAFEIKPSLTEWLGACLFEAATINGAPVMSIFKGGLRSGVRTM